MSNLSRTMKSVLLTKGLVAKHEPRQEVPPSYTIPSDRVRLLAAELVFEEARELIVALGCKLDTSADKGVFVAAQERLDILEIIDGACDLEWVTKNVLAACGVPDKPHMREVAKANLRKFPGGIVTMDKITGKYLKPPGWKEPNHKKVMMRHKDKIDLVVTTSKLVRKLQKKGKKK